MRYYTRLELQNDGTCNVYLVNGRESINRKVNKRLEKLRIVGEPKKMKTIFADIKLLMGDDVALTLTYVDNCVADKYEKEYPYRKRVKNLIFE